MGETWEKMRSLMRGAFSAPAETPPAPRPAKSTPPREPPMMREVDTAAVEEEPVVLRAALRTIDAKADALRRRVDEIETIAREHSSSPDARGTNVAVDALREEVASLRAIADGVAASQSEFRETLASLRGSVTELTAAVAAMDKKSADLTRDIRDARSSAEEAIEESDRVRVEVSGREALRAREVSGRLAPLYVVSFVALLAALGTAVFMAIGSMK